MCVCVFFSLRLFAVSSSTVQGFLSVGGGSRNFGGRRGHGGAQQAKKIKLLMLGDSGVGKSSLMDRFTEDYFNVTTVHTYMRLRWFGGSGVVCLLDWTLT